jgi:Sigma-70, region 4
VAVKPRPELALFFETLARQVPEDVTLKRKRRGSVAPYRQIPDDAIALASAPLELPRYTEPRPGKLPPCEIDSIVSAVTGGRTLRDVGAEFGISAERVRQLVRERERAAMAAD